MRLLFSGIHARTLPQKTLVCSLGWQAFRVHLVRQETSLRVQFKVSHATTHRRQGICLRWEIFNFKRNLMQLKYFSFHPKDLCGKECSSQQLLDKHHLTHGTNNAFQCNICLRSYRHQSTLSRHSKMHTQVSKCHLCYQTFRYDSHLRKHLLDVHNDVNGISQPRITPEVVKVKKKSSTQIESDPNSIESSSYYIHPTQSTVIVNNVVNFKHPY